LDYKEGKLLIEKKVEDFRTHKNIYLSKTFDETENRTHFINPLFCALGWDFEQTNIPYHYWDVHQEFSQKDKHKKTKKPDYAFRLNKKVKFFVEAKASWVNLTDKEPVFQAKSYAFSTNGKAPIVVLTDFEEFRVFNAIERPIFDNPLQGLVKPFDLTFENYIEKWDLLYNMFSKEAVHNNSLESLVGKITKNTKTLDKEFLETLMSWRRDLAMRIAYDNVQLNEAQLNECVQRILDRLIFIRNLEDREIEEDINLIELLKAKEPVYPRLIPIFNNLNASYNGLLFHKHISENIKVDDKTIRTIIKNLYPNLSPFQFDAIEPEILGRIYEKFLGSKIYLTENHQGKVKEKPEVVHAKGVYYTPQWVVDIIVQNTVGNLIKDKNPEQISKIKILDPACGSGSFLLGAYDYILKYHKEWYSKNESIKKYQEDYFKDHNNETILTNRKKSEILKNNIFGVDIDREATEVAIMSLYLKALEEGSDSNQTSMFKRGGILPEMSSNIKCGNTLITRDQLYHNNMFGDDEITPYDWTDEASGFGSIFKENNGFNCVIGNPPYIRIQELQKWAVKEAALYKKLYKSGESGNFDIYVLFIEKSMSLINENGLFGMILPNKFFMADYGENIRKLTHDYICQIINFGDQQVFENATTYTNLLFLSKQKQETFKYSNIKDLSKYGDDLHETIICNSNFKNESIEIGLVDNNSLSESAWQFSFGEDRNFFEKLTNIKLKLSDVTDKILVGLQTSADPVYILDYRGETENTLKLFSKALDSEVEIEKEILKPLLKGKEIRRYSTPEVKNWLIFPYKIDKDKSILIDKKTMQTNFPLCWAYLTNNRQKLFKRADLDKNLWWEYPYPKNLDLFCKPKLITQVLASRASYTADLEGKYYFVGGGNAGGYGVKLKPEYEQFYHYVLGILNSTPIDKYLQHISTQFRGGFYSYAKRFIELLPIYIPDVTDKIKYAKCNQIGKMVKQILEYKQIESKLNDAIYLEKKIDKLVEEIYLNE
jgi:type I restriction-modification system DNA methylase subunit